ncbi:MAG: HlyD family secretion protein, partial [Acetobacteraceae bacterium]|nr:HlyD family secretion protein [Acetobacteraceae bacterium]
MSGQIAERGVIARPPVRAPRLSRKQIGLAAAAILVGLGAARYGDHWWTVGRFIETTDDAYVGGDVTVIAPKVPGFIATVDVADNQAVHAGDLLLKLDDRDYRAALAKAVAAVAGQEATLGNIEANRRLQEAVIAQAKSELTATAAEITRTRYDVDRYRSLSRDNFASVQRYQQADADYQKALAADARARAALEAAQRQLDVLDTQKQQTTAALAGAIAERETAQLNLGYTELRAPIDGTVGNRSARAGAYATAGAQLISLVPAHGLWVDAN